MAAIIRGCRQNLDTPFWTPQFFQWKKKLSYTQFVCHIPSLLSQFSFLRFSVHLERRCSLPRHAFPSSRLLSPRGIRNFLAISYSDNFRKTCHFWVARTPAILFSAILVFPLTSTIEGRWSRPSALKLHLTVFDCRPPPRSRWKEFRRWRSSDLQIATHKRGKEKSWHRCWKLVKSTECNLISSSENLTVNHVPFVFYFQFCICAVHDRSIRTPYPSHSSTLLFSGLKAQSRHVTMCCKVGGES